MSEKQDPIVSTTESDGNSASESTSKPSENGAFFPWLEGDAEKQKVSLKTLARFPAMGAVGLIGSALTIVLSFVVLKCFSGRKVIGPDHLPYFPKPAVWLSTLISANGILLHIAASRGLSITWWFRASRKQTTVADLHTVWDKGTSAVSAVSQWRTFDYIALATVLVAAIPINGIVLQNSVGSTTFFTDVMAPRTFAITSSLPLGSTATLDPEMGSVIGYSSGWQSAMSVVIGNFAGLYRASKPTATDCVGLCLITIPGIGFSETCTDSVEPYDIALDGSTSIANLTDDITIYSADVNWMWTNPYQFLVSTKWKDSSSCSGDLKVRTCYLELGTVDYEAQVFHNVPKDNLVDEVWEWSLVGQSVTEEGYYYPVANFVPYENNTAESSGTINTTYGGIAEALSKYYGSTFTLHPQASGQRFLLANTGFYAQQISVTTGPKSCNTSFTDFGATTDANFDNLIDFATPADFLLDQIRNTLFYTSLYATDDADFIEAGVQRSYTLDDANDFVAISVYRILWKWWGGSVAVTVGIILFILPTFYGFWTLARNTTLSPFETARAFHAPVLHDAPQHLDTPALLKEVGQKNLHTDIVQPAVTTEGRSG